MPKQTLGDLDPDKMRKAFPPVVGNAILFQHLLNWFAANLFPDTEDQEPRVGISLTFLGTQLDDEPDLVFAMNLEQARALRDALTKLLSRADQDS